MAAAWARCPLLTCQPGMLSNQCPTFVCPLVDACSTALHFVRCIKPNSQQVAGTFDAALILHQLRCCGVLEVARIARAGYPTRYLHRDFCMRYKVLLPDVGPGAADAHGMHAAAPLHVCIRACASPVWLVAFWPARGRVGCWQACLPSIMFCIRDFQLPWHQ